MSQILKENSVTDTPVMPVPKYAIGDTVFNATTIEGKRSVDCPDCLGAGVWKVESPAGTKADIPCPRCNGSRKISVFAWSPFTKKLTIGQVRMEWPKASYDSDRSTFQYMCQETGVGSGNIYDEAKLFTSETSASELAQFLASEANERIKDRADQVKFDRFNTYTLEDALKGDADEKRRKAQDAYDHLLQRILELDTYPVARKLGEYGEEETELVSASLTDDDVEAIQNSLVRFDKHACEMLAQHRRDSRD